MDKQYLTCSFCGFEFEKDDTLCVHGCPLGVLCKLIRCPSCGYEFPETTKRLSWLGKLFSKDNLETRGLPSGVQTVKELKSGERANVLCIGGKSCLRHNVLTAFGLAPGAEISLVQQCPSCVIRIGETELALDNEIAREILVQPLH